MASSLQQARGHITIVQEERFRLISDTGQGLLFTLAHNADASAPDLHRWLHAQAHVLVKYEGQPDLASALAHSIRED